MRGLALLAAFGCTEAAKLHQTPVSRVVALITELKAKVEADGRKEQQSYDKYACWCENTLARKAKAISDAKDLIEALTKTILKLKGDLGAHSAEIAQLKKDIAQNLEAQKEASEVRNKENDEYENTKNENEQCIGALEAAIKVLTGAGAGKKGFLETMQEAQLLSVVDGVRGVLGKAPVVNTLSTKDLDTIQKFIKSPEDFVGGRVGVMSAAQIAQNPFGDYAPQSTQIQGILKGMYDAFTADLEKENAEEADKQKAFEELMATKKQEQETLEATLEKQEHDSAKKTKELSDSKITRDDTEAQLKADEVFFEDTKAGCKTKAGEWAERSRLRTEELTGIQKAIEILSSPEAQQTFESSVTTFVQLKSDTHTVSKSYRKQAFTKLRSLAAKYQSTSLAEIAVAVKTGGHFDKVMVMIDKMIALLRKEEAEDIAHRDRCEGSQNKNANDAADLDHDISKAGDQIQRLNDNENDLKATITSLQGSIDQSNSDMKELLEMRNAESKAFKKALKDDADAVALIAKAIVSLSQFYKNNKIPLELVQHKKEPEYSVDQDKAPDTTWSGGDYGGRKGESGGIIAILEMIKEDTENEMKVSRQDDADAEAAYEKNRGALKETLDAETASKVQAEKELADTENKNADAEEFRMGKQADAAEEEKLKASIEKDCAWVKSHFVSRREKRKAEIDGLVEAKNFLAGVEAGDDDELM
jgi:hypothetical protein